MSELHEPATDNQPDVPPAPEPANLSLAIQPAVSVALWQNHVPVLSELVFRAGDETPGEVEISLFCEPPVIRSRTWRLGGVAAKQIRPIADLDIGLDGPFLSSLTEATRAVVHVAATANGTTLAEIQQDVRILAHNEWGGCAGIPDILAAFVEPNDPAVARILRATSDKLRGAGKPDGLEGYQSGNKQRAWEQAEALWRAICALDIRYVNPPPPSSVMGRRSDLHGRYWKTDWALAWTLRCSSPHVWKALGCDRSSF